jgi:hypothetical protein
LKLIPKPVAPSIPKKKQQNDSLTGDLKNSAGPGQYDAKVDQIKFRKPNCNFGASGVKREVWKISETPGPSEYDTEIKR